MPWFLSVLLTALVLVMLVPTLVFAVEVTASCFFPLRTVEAAGQRQARVAVLIPAHDECAGIKTTINDVGPQLRPDDRLVVVADNCTDDTARVAATAGAEVSIRNEPNKIGKGYALDWGINYLRGNPPDIVVMIDADCRIDRNAISSLSWECSQSGRPAQALYLMITSARSSVNQQVAQFAWRVKNLIRPLGLLKMGLPCQLMGTGMAFPWNIIESANLSSGLIVEDMKLGLDLAAQGRAPRFCPSAVVTSTFPTSEAGSKAQRQRWEQGHLTLILKTTPYLIYKAIKRKDLYLFALALDLLVPPLSLLISILITTAVGTAVAAMTGVSAIPFFLVVLSLVLVAAAVLIAWINHGQNDLTVRDFLLIIPYLIRKLSLYMALAAGRKVSRWIRADRD
jgi:cellulose synthase/poly-beta-1,6-N-acetylglucosamine synthase-like glycosyltransferase